MTAMPILWSLILLLDSEVDRCRHYGTLRIERDVRVMRVFKARFNVRLVRLCLGL